MTTQERKVMEMALEVLVWVDIYAEPHRNTHKAITGIKEALAQPEQEPVAYGMWDSMIGCGGRMMYVRLDKGQDGCTVPLYTTPPQRTWVGLTDEEIPELIRATHNTGSFVRAIAAHLHETDL